MKTKQWEEILSKLITSNFFLESISKNGFYLSPEYNSFIEYAKNEWNISTDGKPTQFLSIDFWKKQSPILIKKGYFLIRTGEGSFAILQENKFPRSYLELKLDDVQTIKSEVPTGYENLKKAFSENILENSALEEIRFNKTLEKIILDVTGENEFFIGPRGNTTRAFDIYFKKNDGSIVKIKQFIGQAELDYTVWTKKSVLLFEAKKSDKDTPLDIGWHKFAFSAARFLDYKDLQIFPIYFIRLKDSLLFFVFPKFNFHNNGIILNEKNQMIPKKIFKILL